jgi:hypothetical protein
VPPVTTTPTHRTVFSKVVVRKPGTASEHVVNMDYSTARKRSRFLKKGKTVAPIKYFPSPYDFPDPRLNVPKRGERASSAKSDEDRLYSAFPAFQCFSAFPTSQCSSAFPCCSRHSKCFSFHVCLKLPFLMIF